MNRSLRIGLGIATVVAYVLYTVAILGLVLFVVGVVAASSSRSSQPPPFFFGGFVLFYLGLIVAALYGSALTMAYAFHVAWNDAIAPRTRGLWMLAVYVGGFIAMPIYWFLHVRIDPVPETPAAGEPLRLSRGQAIAAGILTLAPYVLYGGGIVFFALSFLTIPDFANAPRNATPPVQFIVGIVLGYAGLLVGGLAYWAAHLFYGFHSAANSRIERTTRGVWAISLTVAGWFVMPAYWYLEMWRPAQGPTRPPHAVEPPSPVTPEPTAPPLSLVKPGEA